MGCYCTAYSRLLPGPAPCVSKISSPGQPDAECQTSQAYSLLDIIKEPAVQGQPTPDLSMADSPESTHDTATQSSDEASKESESKENNKDDDKDDDHDDDDDDDESDSEKSQK